MNKKVAIYIRVSTTHQIDKDSLPMQRKDLTSYSELIIGSSDYVIFEDAGYSGKNTIRPAYQDMMSRVRNGEFTHILVWKIDRISRNLIDFADMFTELKSLHVTFVSKNENFDTSTAIGEAMLKIILVFAELERNMASERVTATMISRANNGLWNGGRIPFGYDYDFNDCVFSIREDEAEICRKMKDDYLKYKSLKHTYRMLNSLGLSSRDDNEWSSTTVKIILSNPFYAGIYRYNHYKGNTANAKPKDEWIMIPNHHPAIFTVEEHEKMLSILKDNAKRQNTPEQTNLRKNIHVFTGICFCGKCGSRLVASPTRPQVDGYISSRYTCAKRRKSKSCGNPSVNDMMIGNFVLNYISNIITAKKTFSTINDTKELQRILLKGYCFIDVKEIQYEGLQELFNLFSLYPSDKSFRLVKTNRSKRSETKMPALKKELERQNRALSRLQDAFLYSDSPLSRKDYVLQRQDILSKIETISTQIKMSNIESDSVLSDAEFIQRASYLLISSRLQDNEFIYYKKLVVSISPEVLQEYIRSIIDSIFIDSGRITSIVFRNGLCHKFIYDGE